jgi:poly(3-hydroxybutyrate) depolymerase
MRSVLLPTLAAAVLTMTAAAQSSPPPAKIDAAWRAFWDADSPARAEKAAQEIVASGATLDAVRDRLRSGRGYGTQPTGRVELPTTVAGITLDNVAEVPAGYTPDRAWPLRVSLHGGVGRPAPAAGESAGRPLTNRIPGGDEIVLHPRAWAEAEWWTFDQVTNVGRLVERLKRSYNVDESRIYITGISDGGTGVYFFAMRAATPWAACMPLNGHPLVLANPDTGADGELFASNLANCPIEAVNGGKDRLYPAASVQPFVDMFKRGGIPFVWHVYPDANHDTSWWPEERPAYEAFLAAHPRAAQPESVTWETERTDRYNRFRWLVIDKLGKRSSDVMLPDVNVFDTGAGYKRTLYDRSRSSGRVDAVRKGNGFDVKSRGVQELTLLLSPDVVDFSKPVQVAVNGRMVHDAIVKPDAATMLKWVARDHDRTMLYGAELKLVIP